MRMLGRWSLLGFSVAIAAPGVISGMAPGADWRGTWLVYGIAAGLFLAVLWLLMLDGHFRLGRTRRRLAGAVHRWRQRRNVRVGSLRAQAGTSAAPGASAPNKPPQRAQTSRDAVPVPGMAPATCRVSVPQGLSDVDALRRYAARLGWAAYYSDSLGYILHDGAATYAVEFVTA